MIGSKVGPYELIELLGTGGMATVYRARQESMGRFVAVKIIHQAISIDQVAMERFQREAQIIASLEHPHILPVYDFDGAHNPPYIVMRYLPSGTLKDIMERSRLPLEDIVHLYTQLCSALDYAHRSGIIHRDIKPSNVMVDGDANVFLTDFGIARSSSEGGQNLTGTGVAVGTPGYMAPEQTLGVKVDGRVDIYSLGVMLFELLTGSAPFTANTPMAVLMKHINEPPPAPSSVDPSLNPALDAILAKTLAKDPAQRYKSAGELSDELRAVLASPTARATALMNIAQETITDLAIEREQINQTMGVQTGSTVPPSPSAAPSPMDEAPTELITGQRPAPASQGGRKMPIIGVIAVVAVLVVAAIAFFALSGGGDDDDNNDDGANATQLVEEQLLTQTSEALAASLNQTQTAVAADAEIDEPTVVTEVPTEAEVTPDDTDAPTEVVQAPSETDVPTETSTPTHTVIPSETPSEATARVTVGRGVIFLEPNPRSEELLTAPEAATMLVIGETADGRWYQVEYFGDIGWILADQVEVTGNFDTIVVVIPSETPTPTATATPTITPSFTPTLTLTPTVMPSATLTATTASVIDPTTAPTQTPIPSPTPIPAGAMPFVSDLESDAPLDSWAFAPDQWQVRTDGGNTALYGTTGFDSSLTILGREVPEWVQEGEDDLLLSFRVNLLENNSGGRFIFKFEPDNGYYVLEMLSGLILLKRGEPGLVPVRGTEREIERVSPANITTNRWYNFIIWVEGSRIFVYQEQQLIISTEDRGLPLAPGSIVLQTFSSVANPVGWDDFIIQRPESASEHFEGSGFPTTWERSSQQNVEIGVDGTGNQYARMVNDAEVEPVTPALTDFILYSRLNNVAAGFEMFIRESNQGALELDWDAGNITISQLNSGGEVVFTETLRNYYGRGRFEEFVMTAVGQRITIWDGSDIVFEEDLAGLPSSGFIRFQTQAGDELQIDDFLVAETALSSTFDAQFAFEILDELATRDFRELLWDWTEDFSDPFRTRSFWEGDIDNDPGDYVLDESVPAGEDHRRYYTLASDEFPASRLIRTGIDSTRNVFGNGDDRATFRDSVDLYVEIDMRLPADAPVGSVAWVGVRSEQSASGVFSQYRVALVKGEGGETIVEIGPDTPTDRTPIYTGVLDTTDWVEVIIITLDDQIAYLVDGRVLATDRDLDLLGGTVAVGVEGNSLGHFDDLVIRDTSVNE